MMSEVEELEQEVEISAVEQMINQISAGDLNKAEGSFHSIIQDKMADALEAQRIATAQAIFNGQDDDIEDGDEDLEVEDETDDFLEIEDEEDDEIVEDEVEED
jgi:hypothetical protein|tara:strand:- start:464 stop:772 length:309 start_codon:yes stop_codon:yes gene_type:complete